MTESNTETEGPGILQKIGSAIKAVPTHYIIMAVIILVVLLAINWIFFTPIPTISEEAKDYWERAIDKQIDKNIADFAMWYRFNIMLQAALILTSLFATIAAAVTTADNIGSIKKYSIVLTAITSALTAIISTFHIRENIETFIRINGDLQVLEWEYVRDRAPFMKSANANEVSPQLLAIQYELSKKFVTIQSARLRAYASIGAQSLPTPAPSSSPPPAPAPANTDAGDIAVQGAKAR